jgi:hypothetical protein
LKKILKQKIEKQEQTGEIRRKSLRKLYQEEIIEDEDFCAMIID